MIDAACRVWISTGSLPLGMENAEMGALVWDRFVEAREFAKRLQRWEFRIEGATVDDVLLFLLVDFWASYGVLRLKERLAYMP